MDSDSIWQTVLNDLELVLSRAEFTTWFKNTAAKIDPTSKETITVLTPDIFAKEWIKKKYHEILLEKIKNIDSEITKIEYDIKGGKPKKPTETTEIKEKEKESEKPKQEPNPKTVGPKPNFKAHQISSTRPGSLNPRYTFESYIVGSNSELAYAAAQAVIESPGIIYNPLYIYGQVGLGKTHLLQATGNLAYDKYGSKVLYLPSEIFLSEIVAAIKKGSIEDLKLKYRNVDILILDDIQIISGKEKFQEIFFDTFNALYSQGKQIILSSDCLPSDIPALEDRLRSRFHGGMIADISLPDLETRMAILRLKSEKQNFILPEETIEYIAHNLAPNIRQMEGALNRLVTQCQLSQHEADIEYAKDVLTIIAKESTALEKKVSPKALLRITADHYSVSEQDIKGKSRKKEIVFPRQVVMFLLRSDNKLAYPTIGRMLGGRDHSTVIHSIKKIEKERSLDSNIEKDLKAIRQKLKKEY